jgi:uncharacterized protein (TIGR03083 family)
MTSSIDPGDPGEPGRPAGSHVQDLVRVERLALVSTLEALGDEEWRAPSLCAAWTVQDVAAHLAWAPVLRPLEGVAGLCRAGFRMNAYVGASAVRWSHRGRDAILEQLRDNAATGVGPPGVPDTAVLTDAVVHGLDIRRPLGRPRPIPPEAFRHIADWNADLRWPMTIPVGGSVRRRLRGVRLVADGLDWSHGDGPGVRGSTEALMLVLTGRQVGPGELTGPGAAELYARLTRT